MAIDGCIGSIKLNLGYYFCWLDRLVFTLDHVVNYFYNKLMKSKRRVPSVMLSKFHGTRGPLLYLNYVQKIYQQVCDEQFNVQVYDRS